MRKSPRSLSSAGVASRERLKERGGDRVRILSCSFVCFRILPHPQPSLKHPTSWEFPQQDMVQGLQVKVMPSADQGD